MLHTANKVFTKTWLHKVNNSRRFATKFIRLSSQTEQEQVSAFTELKMSEVESKHVKVNLNTIHDLTTVHPALYEAMLGELFKSISNINKS